MSDKAKTCQGCPDRVVGCHSRCAGYMRRQGRWQEAPATYLEKADYAMHCMHKSLESISLAFGRISRLCGFLRAGQKGDENALPTIITHNESRMALKHLAMVKSDVDEAYQEILSIFESTKEPGTVSETESVGQDPEPGMRKEAGKDEAN